MTDYSLSMSFKALLLLTLAGCCEMQNGRITNAEAGSSTDSVNYTLLKTPFYKDKHGNIVEKKIDAFIGEGNVETNRVYYDSIVFIRQKDSIMERTLSEIIDIDTYTEFDQVSCFSKDKNNVYFSYVNSGGSYRFIVNKADPKTFRALSDYKYGMDDKHLFYQSKMIEGLNFSKHEILYTLDTTDFFIEYIKDDKLVFYNGDTLKGADAGTFKLMSGKAWSAIDKNFKYDNCGQRIE